MDLTIHDTLIGTRVPASGQAGKNHTIRLKLGEYPDGTVGGIAGTPRLAVGDEVIVLLKNDSATGLPRIVPFNVAGDGLYRVFTLDPGVTGVVDGTGRAVLTTHAGRPLLGPVMPNAVSNFPPGNPVVASSAIAELKSYRGAAISYGSAPLGGKWKLAVRFMVDHPVTYTTGSGTITPPHRGPLHRRDGG